ncbi:MAG: hypothetical protein NC313_14850 [Butyrivibrio sp.]|nr:hypothetical protein [Butyrivibrio sp.]
MADFFPDVLDKFISYSFLEEVRKKFHFEEKQEYELKAVAEAMLPSMREEAFWKSDIYSGQGINKQETDNRMCEQVVMCLGKGLDCLQERYSEEGLLSQSYMVEVLASELLLKGYAAYNDYIRENTNWHVARYYFFGSEETLPLEMLPGLLKELTPFVSCNSAFCMTPKKSVVFIAELTQDEKAQCRGICEGCNNVNCPNRMADDIITRKRLSLMTDMPLTYGYSRIFSHLYEL